MLSRRSGRRQFQKVLILGGILLALGLGSTRLLAPPTEAGGAGHSAVAITEFVAASQTTLADEDGEYPDWIELHNRSTRSVNLLGWSLTDDPAEPDKWPLPNLDLPAGERLVVFASGKDRPALTIQPKEAPPGRMTPPYHLHTNFKLSAEGGYLALYDNTSRRFLDAVAFTYPRQLEGLSYGACDTPDGACYMAAPTPGQPNDESGAWPGLTEAVTASAPHGFYDAPFEVTLATETPGAAIWYTTDGSEPAEGRGQLYSAALPVSATTVLRAVAVKAGYLAGAPATFSYIFPEQVQHQPEDPPGYPVTWGAYRSNPEGYTVGAPVPADYAMDPEVVEDPRYRQRMRDSLLALPSLSLVTSIENLDIYFVDPLQRGIESERPVSVEWLDPTGQAAGFQVDAGLRIQGKLGRSELAPKHSFRLLFRNAYGPAQLEYGVLPGSRADKFDVLVLRAGAIDSFAGYVGAKSRLATYAKDEWLRRSQLAASGFSAAGRFVHLYLNGLYWGVYNLVERPDASFAASYLGGDEDEWLSAKPGGADEGIVCRIDTMRRLAELGQMADPVRYAAMLKYIDPVQFSDYVLLHWYAGAEDCFENNWYIAMQKPEGPFLFFAWDAEKSWLEGAQLYLGGDRKDDRYFPNIVKALLGSLMLNPDFRMTLADRLYKHTSPGGALSDAAAQARWLEITGELEEAIIADSARWGDAWYEPPITLTDWRQGRDLVLGQMNGNGANLLALARAEGYYPPIDPPAFSQESASFEGRMRLAMSVGQGDIYYTLDGSDPRTEVTGAVSPAAVKYASPIELSRSTPVRARVLEGGVWSALHEADFSELNQPSGLRITELMYNPIGSDDHEFLELTNVGGIEVDLSGAVFEGIDLQFGFPTRLAGGDTLVLAADAAAFEERYGDVPVAAEYGGELADRGETIALRDAGGELMLSLTYDDENDWPLTADGKGDSLVLADLTGDINDPGSWEAGGVMYGAPGTAEEGTRGNGKVQGKSKPAGTVNAGAAQPSHAIDVRFGDDLTLAGYDVYRDGRPVATDGLPVVQPGDAVEVVLYWRIGRIDGQQAFLSLLTPDGQSFVQIKRSLGLLAQPQTDCSDSQLVPDRYTFRIPADATNGLIQPVLHAYNPTTATRLPVYSEAGAEPGVDYRLPMLKIARSPCCGASGSAPSLQHELHARFGEQIELLGYGLEQVDADAKTPGRKEGDSLEEGGTVRAGDQLTVTLFFRAQAPIAENLTRTVQLHSTEHGMAGQNDAQPAGGRNPTWAWQAGEVVVDHVILTIAPDAVPGSYSLLLGLYNPADGARLPVEDEAGNAAPDQVLRLQDIMVDPTR